MQLMEETFEEMENKVPHYVELCMKLKEETDDHKNYFIEEWKDPDEARKRQIMLFKERRRKAHESTKQFQQQQRKKKPKGLKPNKAEQFYSTNIEYRKIKSPVNASANKNASKLKLDFHSHSQIIQVNKHEKCDNLQDEVERLRAKLVETEAKYLNFILRGNPTHKKQVDMELQWLFAQIRDGEDSKRDDQLKKMKQENDLLKKENAQLSHRLVQHINENGSHMNVDENTLRRIAACYEDLCEHHQLNWLKTEDNGPLNMDDLLLKLEQVVNKIRNKKNDQSKKKKISLVNKRKSIKQKSIKKRKSARKSTKRKSIVEEYQYPEPQQSLSRPSQLDKLKTIKKKVKKGKKNKRKSKENTDISNNGLKKQREELNALNVRVSKLDTALRESSAMLNDILVANV